MTFNTDHLPAETHQFLVICPNAGQVFLLGDFNNWSTTATPMCETEKHTWELSVEMPRGDHRFGYFVIDREFGTGRASFGSTYLLPGTWAVAVKRRSVDTDTRPTLSV